MLLVAMGLFDNFHVYLLFVFYERKRKDIIVDYIYFSYFYRLHHYQYFKILAIIMLALCTCVQMQRNNHDDNINDVNNCHGDNDGIDYD